MFKCLFEVEGFYGKGYPIDCDFTPVSWVPDDLVGFDEDDGVAADLAEGFFEEGDGSLGVSVWAGEEWCEASNDEEFDWKAVRG